MHLYCTVSQEVACCAIEAGTKVLGPGREALLSAVSFHPLLTGPEAMPAGSEEMSRITHPLEIHTSMYSVYFLVDTLKI